MITIKGELTDLNTYINAERSHRYMGSKLKKQETNTAEFYARMSDVKPVTTYPVTITYKWYSKNARKDVDNVAFAKKFINDGLVNAGILEDDSRKYISGFADEFYIDKDNPRIEVIINPNAQENSKGIQNKEQD